MSKHKYETDAFKEFLKCGEIFHNNGSFRIICTDCDEKLFAFEDFLDHFQKNHCSQEENFKDVMLFDSCSPKHNPVFGADFEAVTIISPDSPLDIKNFSTDEEENVLEDIQNIEQIKSSNDQLNNNDNKKKIPLQLRKKHACEKCPKEFVTKRGLNKHIRRRHFEPKEYNCNQCKETFPDRTSLWKHERMLHITFACTMCDKSYKNRRNLREHLLSHNEISTFICDYEGCTKSFKSQRRLYDHKNAHMPKETFVCEVCGYRTVRRQTLVQHARTHTGEKPYPCKICGKHFISSSMVKEHLASHATERPYVCDVCGASFTRPKALYHHKPLHLGIKKFVCSICDKAYAQAAGLSAHMRKHKIGGKIAPGLE